MICEEIFLFLFYSKVIQFHLKKKDYICSFILQNIFQFYLKNIFWAVFI